MFLQNISKRKILLLIINALVSVLLISCILFLYHYIPSATNSRTPSIFTVEKGNGIHITKASSSHFIASSGSPTRSVIVANVKSLQSRRPTLNRLPQSSSEEEALDDTIYIDSDSYSDESYDSTSTRTVTSRENDDNDDDDGEVKANDKNRAAAPVTIIERPVERAASDDDLYYENYEDEDETDDEDIVSSGNGRIVVNVRKAKASSSREQRRSKQQPTQPPPPEEPSANYVENVYSVSSEIVSNLKSQYNSADEKQQQPSNDEDDSDDELEDLSDDEERTPPPPPTTQPRRVSSKRLTGNSKKLAERSRQLILCRSANMGELCRMLN